jgi:hypothetical protein
LPPFAFKFLLHCALLVCAVAVRGAEPDAKSETKAEAVKITQGTNGETILTLDAETQKWIGLEVANPIVLPWQPELRVTGRVADPLPLVAAAADLESARFTAEASQRELDRMQKLTEQNNASTRSLETAQATVTHDRLALKSAQAKLAADWGQHLVARTNLAELVEQLATGQQALVRLNLPMGAKLATPPASAKILPLDDQTTEVAAELADDLGVDASTQMPILSYLADGAKLSRGVAVSAILKTSGEVVSGVVVPASAILRHEGKGSVFLQTGENSFSRREVSLDRAVADGFFSADLSATNRIVVMGAQTLLSAELSGGGFNSGQRD